MNSLAPNIEPEINLQEELQNGMGELPITFRSMVQNDYAYVLETFSRQYHKTEPANFIPNSVYIPRQTEIINQLLNRSEVIVACIDDEPDSIAGYIMFQHYNSENIIMHWANVKGIFRRLGIFKSLLNKINVSDKNIICTHYFNLFKKLKYKYRMVYDPSLLDGLLK